MAREITIMDKEVRKAIKRAIAEIKGKKPWPVGRTFKKYKKARLWEPWKYRGIDETGRKGTWKPLTDETARRKNPGKFPVMWWSDRQGTYVSMDYAMRHYEQYMLGGGHMMKSDVPMSARTKDMLKKTGAMRDAMTVGWSSKKHPPKFEVYPKRMKAKSRYPFFHLHGKSGTVTRTQRRKRKVGRNEKGQWIYQDEEYQKTYQVELPARPWAAWTPKDLNEFVKEFRAWFAKTF